MRAWSAPEVPDLSASGPEVQLFDTATQALVATSPDDGVARLYVCGITPYDATHMGHAATYVAFDLLNRAWRSAGYDVHYVQNVTDIDDPLLERALATGQDWTAIAERETELFRTDMEALRVLPPREYIGAVEAIDLVSDLIEVLRSRGAVQQVDDDLYFTVASDPEFGQVSNLSREQMAALFAERGGDPERPGKQDPLDCLVWMAQRPGEPGWESPFGMGRPGWHIECTAIAEKYLGDNFDVQGGGSDLVFPHHEMCASEAHVARQSNFAKIYSHAGMVALDGEKMSKSRGNLVFVSTLREAGVDPMAVRLVLLRHHYRSDWEWTQEQLADAVATIERWRGVLDRAETVTGVDALRSSVLGFLANDLNAPAAVAAIDAWMVARDEEAADDTGGDPERVRQLLDASLGLAL